MTAEQTKLAEARTEDAKAARDASILDLTTCLLLRFHRCGLIRKGNISRIQTLADKNRLGLNKKILTSDNYDQLLTISRDCRRYAKKRQVPGSPFAEGTHLVPLPLVDDLDKKIANAEQAYNRFADLFVAEYPKLIEDAEAGLKDQWDASNYFDTDELGQRSLRSRFWVERRWFDWTPSNEAKVSKAIAYQERQRQGTEIQDMALQVKAALRMGLKKLIDHLVERLTPGPGGSRKQFAPTTVTKVVDWLALFSARNVVGDSELALLANQAKEILGGADPSTLRTDEDLAAVVATQMTNIKTNLDQLVQDLPDRAINLEDEADDDE